MTNAEQMASDVEYRAMNGWVTNEFRAQLLAVAAMLRKLERELDVTLATARTEASREMRGRAMQVALDYGDSHLIGDEIATMIEKLTLP